MKIRSSTSEVCALIAQRDGWRARAKDAERELLQMRTGLPAYRASLVVDSQVLVVADRPDVHPEQMVCDLRELRFSHPRVVGGEG